MSLYTKKSYQNTDLACERMRADTTVPGIIYREEDRGICRIGRLTVESEEGAESIGKPMGRYITMSFSPIFEVSEGELHELSEVLSELLTEMCRTLACERPSLLVAGIGNRGLTADALGPDTAKRILATRQLKIEEPQLFTSLADAEISIITPGVMGETGIEAGDLIGGAVAAVSPDLVLAVDALAARSVERLAATVQLSDTGIRPGSGIGNARRALDRESLGVPVLSIGLPTVVNSATLIYDSFCAAGLSDGEIPEALEKVLATGKSFFVSPRECDIVNERGARLISDAINLSFCRRFFTAQPI